MNRGPACGDARLCEGMPMGRDTEDTAIHQLQDEEGEQQ